MIELLDLESKLKTINARCRPAQIIYLYGDYAYLIVYNIIKSYKNYLYWPKILA